VGRRAERLLNEAAVRGVRDEVDIYRAALEQASDLYAQTGGMDMHLQAMCQAAIQLSAAKIKLAELRASAKV
jgi:hypothetical protein